MSSGADTQLNWFYTYLIFWWIVDWYAVIVTVVAGPTRSRWGKVSWMPVAEDDMERGVRSQAAREDTSNVGFRSGAIQNPDRVNCLHSSILILQWSNPRRRPLRRPLVDDVSYRWSTWGRGGHQMGSDRGSVGFDGSARDASVRSQLEKKRLRWLPWLANEGCRRGYRWRCRGR